MKKKSKSDPASHDDNPEWTAEDFAKARPASEMPDGMLDYFKATKAKLGRPPAEVKKVPVKLRLDPAVLEALRASGPGWQTRINDMLAASVKGGKVIFRGRAAASSAKPAKARPAARGRRAKA